MMVEMLPRGARLLGTVENNVWVESRSQRLEDRGCGLIVSSSKEGPDSVFQKELPDNEILIIIPFHPGYLTKELITKTNKLKLATSERNITAAEVSGSNVVAEHVLMSILLLVRKFTLAREMINNGDCRQLPLHKGTRNVQTTPRDHPWRTMSNPSSAGKGMVPHYSGTSLDAQMRYAMVSNPSSRASLDGTEQDPAIIVAGGSYATRNC
ncbi:hypothetical protein BS47DRAFT_1379745 [Hydnum rufescens UP504]|uniref:Uncharacterized protein n=1 Tax=Hydnum rufescens UP504 TaxID=1448309 RepID=A0A9P6B6G8_9AGAM|nr:hypothetical protein BS47DRAFT_1379745 [Hydnum rufescens UP504]